MSTIKAGKIQPPGDSDPLQIFTNTVERMTVTSGGLVGVGTTTPTAKLQALNSVGNVVRFGTNNVNSLTIGGNDSSPYAGIGYNINFNSGNPNQYFAVGADRTSLIRFADGGFEFKGNATDGAISGTPFALTEYMTILKSGVVNIPGSLTIGDFRTGNVAPNSVLQRGAASVVGRIFSFFIIALTPADIASGLYAYYTTTPLDPGVWEIHASMNENNADDEDTLYEYHTVATVPANNFLTYRLTGVAGTSTAVGLQYRFQSSGSSQNAYTSTTPAWSDIGLTNTISASTSSNSDSIIGDGIRNGLVGYPPLATGTNSNTIAYFKGYAKRIA